MLEVAKTTNSSLFEVAMPGSHRTITTVRAAAEEAAAERSTGGGGMYISAATSYLYRNLRTYYSHPKAAVSGFALLLCPTSSEFPTPALLDLTLVA